MKISVHLEADSAEELQAFFAAFQVKGIPAIGEQHTFARADAEDRAKARFVEAKAIQEPEPVTDKSTDLSVSTPTVEDVKEPVTVRVPAKRGRKPKAAQQEPKPEPAPAPPEEPQQTPPPKPVEPPVAEGPTRADLSDTFNAYIRQYGHFGFDDVSALLQQTFGETVRKASDVTDDNLARAIHVVRQAVLDNPFNRKTAYAN